MLPAEYGVTGKVVFITGAGRGVGLHDRADDFSRRGHDPVSSHLPSPSTGEGEGERRDTS